MSRSKLQIPSVAYKPFVFPWAIEFWDRHEDMHWLTSEAPIGDDVEDWKSGRLLEEEKLFITQNLRMFTQSDVNVGAFYYDYLIPTFKNNEVRVVFGGNANREATHQRSYGKVVDTLNLPETEYKAFLEYEEMSAKHEFMLDASVATEEDKALALVKAVCNEGITLFASFVMLLTFTRRGLMRGMGTVVEWSIRDEHLHVETLAAVFSAHCAEFPEIVTDEFKRKVYDTFRKTIELEDAYIKLAYGVSKIEGLKQEDVHAYIRYMANRRLRQLGMKEIWDVPENPLPWVDWMIEGESHSNFFENKSSEYGAEGMSGEFTYPEMLPLEVVIHSRPDCGYCDRAKALAEKHIPFYSIVEHPEKEERLAWFAENGFEGMDLTMPKVYEVLPDGSHKLIGGATEFEKRVNNAPNIRLRSFIGSNSAV